MHTSGFDPVVMRQARIGRSLREVYDCVTDTPLPDQFDALLAQLDKINLGGGSR
ncbi:NepR family anti-sigma factor [Blastomonas sp.]|uniref:NepR family anti-sigma factor n=1 Tax=Blastomonas TaxID=150203 RepID=UPI0025880779|nr:NepR family anti-sigma factor [Blastomonas sp.]